MLAERKDGQSSRSICMYVSARVCEEPIFMNDVVPANSVFLIVQIFPRVVWVRATSYVRFNLDPSVQGAVVGNYAVLLKLLCSTL